MVRHIMAETAVLALIIVFALCAIPFSDVEGADVGSEEGLKEALTSEGKGEYTLTEDVTLGEAITMPSGADATLDLNGHKVTLQGTLKISSGATLTVKDDSTGGEGSIHGANNTIDVFGNLNIEGGSISTGMSTSNSWSIRVNGSGELNMSGGTVHSGTGYAIMLSNNSEATITGGTVGSPEDADGTKVFSIRIYPGVRLTIGEEGSVEGPTIYSLHSGGNAFHFHSGFIKSVPYRIGEGSTLNGTFGSEPTYLPEGYRCVPDGNGNYKVVSISEEHAVAVIGNNRFFSTLYDAASAMADGDTLTLLRDYEGTITISVTIASGTIDLNGHTITNTASGGIGIRIAGKGDYGTGSVQIIDSARSAASIKADVPVYATPGNSNNTLTIGIEGVDLVPTGDGNSVELNSTARMAYDETTLGYIVDGGFLATTEDGSRYIYGSMGGALLADANNSTTLLNDYSGRLAINSAGKYTVDLGGHTVTATGDDAALDVSVNGCDLTVLNGMLISKGDGVLVGIGLAGTVYRDISLTLDGVDVYSDSEGYGIVTNGMDEDISISLVDSFVTSSGYGIYFPSSGSLTIEDSKIRAEVTGIELRGGSLTIRGNGTEISGMGEFSANPNGNGTTVTGAAIAVSQHTTNHDISVTIEGGTFIGAYSIYEVDLQDDSGNIAMSVTGGTFDGKVYSQNVRGFITGGMFETDVSDYVAEGSSMGQSGGMFEVSSEPDFPPFIPVPDDDDPLPPPSMTVQGSSEGDDTIKVVAVAAAAVVAAILAILLAADFRKRRSGRHRPI